VTAVALAGLTLVLAATLLLSVLHFNPVIGVYSYDPRHEQPNEFFLRNRPDDVLVQTLAKQIERDGSYPPGSTVKLVRIEPIHVDLATYSDWATEARVTARLYYEDGTASMEVFRFRDAGSEGMLMPIAPGMEMSIRAQFGRLAGCTREQPGASYCGLDTSSVVRSHKPS
jgi:hypothetical protein